MKEHRLFSLLRTFSRKEMTRLVDFAASPYHNKHQDTLRLLQVLEKGFPEFSEKDCDRYRIWRKLFPQQGHDQPKLAVLFTYALRLTEAFLVQEQLNKQGEQRSVWLLETLRERRIWSGYRRHLAKAKKEIASSSLRDGQHYWHRFSLAAEADQFFILEERRREDNSIQEKQAALDHFYVLEKLRDAIEMQIRRQILQGEYSARLLEAVLHELATNTEGYSDAPAIQVYYQIYEVMQEPSLDRYQQARQTFNQYEYCFQRKEVAAIYNYLMNICIARGNKNDTPFLWELIRLYRAQLERGLLSEEGFLIEWHYKNIVTTALRLGELEWANDFIESYQAQLHPDSANNAYRFNKAAYCHAIGDYDQVLALLTQVEYSDLRYNLGAKALLLRTYYELEAFESLNALVDTFRQYLQRNRLLADMRRGGYYHLFRLTRRAASIRENLAYRSEAKIQQSIQKLRQEMEQAPAIFNQAWLEDKLQELERAV